MPSLRTKCFEDIEYSETSLYYFRCGLPGFEQEQEFLFLNRPDRYPLLFMQSTRTADLCFILMPVLAVDPHYRLALEEEALSELRLAPGCTPRLGEDILCAGIICARGSGEPPTVNLLAPIVVNLRERVGIQAIQTQSGYSHRHPLVPREELATCS